RRVHFMPERWATLVKGHPEVLWLLIPNELLQHILKAEYRLSRQATRGGQLLTNGKKGAIHIRRPIDKVHYRPLSHSLAPEFEARSRKQEGPSLPAPRFLLPVLSQKFPQQLIHQRRIGLALRGFHGLAYEEPKDFLFTGAIVFHLR